MDPELVMPRKQTREEPLTPVVFHVLMALAEGPLHGYAIMKRVEEESGMVMGPGTIYGSLHRLEETGWVIPREDQAEDPRRGSSFALSDEGKRALERETARLGRLVQLAERRGLSPDPASAS